MTEKKSPEREQPTAPFAAPAPAQTSDKKSPEEWAGTCGQRRAKSFEETVTRINGKPFDVIGDFLWEHESASVLHGWKLHEHHAGEPMKLSRSEYEAALKAAGITNSKGDYTPHPAALSPHKPKPAAPVKGA